VLGPTALAGAYLFAAGAGGLGRQLTPFPKPVERASLRRDGAFGLVRHPIYGGVLMLALAWSLLSSPVALVPWAGASLFLDAKRRREEAWLSDVNPEYEAYRREVRHSFMPFVWYVAGSQARGQRQWPGRFRTGVAADGLPTRRLATAKHAPVRPSMRPAQNL
jgi:hypothetical protein